MNANKQKKPLVTVSGLSMIFPADDGSLDALSEINLTLYEEEFVCVIGPSGSGKSTLLRILANVLEPTSGRVIFNNSETPKRAIVFQSSNLLPWMKVIDNIALPLKIKGIPEEQALEEAAAWIRRVKLQGFENEWPQTLSGGMRQRVAIARALVQRPELLLMDEPFGSLDAFTRDQMGIELLETWQAFHPTVLMVTHSISEAVLLADRVLVFSDRPGHIIHEMKIPFGRPRDPELRDEMAFVDIVKRLRGMMSVENL